MKSVIFNCRLCLDYNGSVEHADLTSSHRDHKNENFPIAHIQVKLFLLTNI